MLLCATIFRLRQILKHTLHFVRERDLGMTTGNSVNNGDSAVWEAELLRLTGFTAEPQQIEDLSWWAELTGQLPEVRTSKPKAGELSDHGVLEGGQLRLLVRPPRIDWLFTGVSQPEGEEESPFRTLGSLPGSLDKFSSLMLTWLESSCPPLKRMAFGAKVFTPVDGQQTAYRLLADYLPAVQLDPEGMSDFLYQINRPRVSSRWDGLRLNRLSKWSASLTRLDTLALDSGEIRGLPGGAWFACNLELDINTDAAFEGEFSGEELCPLFQELVDLGIEIANRGETP